MANFLLLVCEDECKDENSFINILKQNFNIIAGRIKPNSYENWVEIIEIQTGVSAFIMKLPYYSDRLYRLSDRKINSIGNMITGIKKANGIDAIYLSNKLSQLDFSDFKLNFASGKMLYRALLLNILDEIYSGRGISIRDLDITIVHGDDDAFLYELVELLADHVKFVTVVTNCKERVQENLNGIYSEKGLSIGVTKDFKRGLKPADVIINLGDLREFIINSRINTKAIIINYGNLDKRKVFTENKIISGIEIDFPDTSEKLVLSKVKGHFDELQLAEIIISHKEPSDGTEYVGLETHGGFLMNASKSFQKSGFRIKRLWTS